MKYIITESQSKRLMEVRGKKPTQPIIGQKKCLTQFAPTSFIAYCNTSEVKDALSKIPNDVSFIYFNTNEFVDFSNFTMESYPRLNNIAFQNTETNLENYLPSDSWEKDGVAGWVEYDLIKPRPFEEKSINLNQFLNMVKENKNGEKVYWDKISNKFYIMIGYNNYILNLK
jgi:hypothetical protein